MRRSRQRRFLGCFSLAAILLLACLCIGLSLGVFTGGARTAARPIANRIVYGLTLMPDGFDPHVTASIDAAVVLRSLYDTLVYRDPRTREFVPGLAERWSISDDGLTYTFVLRAGVKFQDATSVDSKAIAANLDRITNPATRSQKALALLGPYDHNEIVDPRTIKIVLSSPYTPLLDGLAQPFLAIASPTAFKQYDYAQYQFHQVGSGPYQMVDYVPGDHFIIRRNPDYAWGPKFYTPPGPRTVEEVEFRFFPDPATRAPALESGAANVIGELSPADAILFTGNSELRLYPQPVPGEPLQFLFNTTLAPTDNLDMRKALLLATNRNAVVDAVDHILDKGGEKLHLVMVVSPRGFAPQVADKIQAQWRELGIELEIKEVPNLAGLQAVVQSGKYNLMAYQDFGIDPDVVNALYRSDSPNNWLHHADGNLDSWLSRGRASLDPELRQNMYTALQNHVVEQALILPIRDYVNLNGASAKIQGLTFDAYGWYPLLPNISLADTGKSPAGQ